MILSVDLAEARDIDMGIDLGRGDIRVSEHLLNRSNIRPVGEQMRREAVPENMRGNAVRGDADGCRAFANYLEDALPCKRPSET